jgi:hypothetical protein
MRHRTLAELSLLVYSEWHDIIEGFEYRIDGQVVSIAGTKDGRDFFTDARFLPRWEDGLGLVSGGFWDVASDLSVRIAREVRGPVTLTGHSAGGAIALLVGANLASHRMPVKEIVTYGAPRVGRLKILDDVNHCHYRYGRDLVTYLGIRGSKGRLVKVGKPSKWWPNLKDHSMLKYREAV